ncbi:QWRF family [Dillenia turbinata]|uniref:QWRF family n=1 Tax=Dillenia turbinata TaxID=194707 RepID=A0AAN8UWM8_9MAGN
MLLDYLNPKHYNRQRSCSEISGFEDEKQTSKENLKPLIGSSMRYSGKLRFSVDERALSRNRYRRKSNSFPSTLDSESENSESFSGTNLVSSLVATYLSSTIKSLEAWGEIDRQHNFAVSKTTDCLHSVVCRVPLIEGALVDPQSTVIALRHANELTISIKSTLNLFAPPVEKTVSFISELAKVVAQERSLIEECQREELEVFSHSDEIMARTTTTAAPTTTRDILIIASLTTAQNGREILHSVFVP